MSFYGNITNTSRTHFQFDRIYASRREMESHKSEDGVYAGRFVLVEYDNQMHMDSFLRISRIENTNDVGEYYAVLEYKTPEGDFKHEEVKLTRGNIHKGTIVYTSAYEESSAGGHFVKNCVFYKCTSDYEENNTDPATFEKTVSGQQFIYLGKIDECLFQSNLFYIKSSNDYYTLAETWSADAKYYILSNYITNHALDMKCYGRGYDSTVWQKVYVGGQEKYIMIAELNAITPSFDIEADAPTQAPIAPHFDLESSDLYYKLHYQPSWGLRVKGARVERGSKIDREGNEIPDTNIDYMVAGRQFIKLGAIEESEFIADTYYIRDNNNFIIAKEWEENVEYYELTYIPLESKSDEMTIWNRTKYDPKTGVTHTVYWHSTEANEDNTGNWQETPPIAPDNNDQNDERTPAAIYYNRAGFESDVETTDYSVKDCITLTPSGQSGQEYNIHDGATHYFDVAPDIQELSIMLPSLGNSVAEMWNIIYGEGQQDNDNQRNKDIAWNSKNGLRMVHPIENGYTYSPIESETLAGAINSVHDLMGMIIVDTQEPITPDSASNNKIYYYNGKFYKKHISYQYAPLGYTKVDSITEENFDDQTLYIWDSLEGNYVEAEEWSETAEYYTYTEINEVPDNMQYIKVNWEFNPFQADKYFYGGAATQDASSVYHLETQSYPTYGYNYQTTSIADESFFNKITLSNYSNTEYYKVGDVILRPQSEGQSEIKGIGYINGDETPDPNVEYSKINIIPIDTYTVNGITPLKGKKPYVPDAYYIYPLETSDPDSDITTKQIMPGDDLTKIIKAGSNHVYNEKNFYYLPKVIGDDLLFDLWETFDPQTTEYANKLYYSTTEHRNNKLISCHIPGTNNDFRIPSSILSDDTFEFFIVEEIEKTRHFYRPRAYYTVTAEEERDGREEKLAIEYTLSIATQSDDTEEYYELNKNIKTVSLNPQDYIKSDWSEPRYYVSHSYYYKLDNGQYVIDRENTIGAERYKEVQNMNADKFNDGIYYILNSENKYEKATEYDKSQKYWSLDYFIKENTFYVKTDKNEYFGIGSEWNPNVTTIPEDVVLATRIPVAEMQELKGFADTLNTIHGLILKINNILLTDDAYTRDNATVQGCINLMNDMIQRFEIIAPGQVMLVDDYGRVHSALTEGDNWINVDINSNAVEPTIKIYHEQKYNPEEDYSESDLDPNGEGITVENIALEHLTIDNAGHVTSKEKVNFILPNSFKQIYVNNDNEEFIVANHYKDSFNINGDEAILISANNETNSINLQHKLFKQSEEENSISFTEELQELRIPIYNVNETGHITTINYQIISFVDFWQDMQEIKSRLLMLESPESSIYNNGTSAVGEWNFYNVRGNAQATDNGEYLYIKGVNDSSVGSGTETGLKSSELFNFQGYSTLKIHFKNLQKVDTLSQSNMGWRLLNKNSVTQTAGTIAASSGSNITESINISDWQGEYLIDLYVVNHSNSNAQAPYMTIDRIWLEK